MADYDENTFDLEDTPSRDSVDESVEETPEVVQEEVSTPEPVPDEVETPEVETPETPPEDNWEVRARYQQSEADKYKNIAEQQSAQLQQVLESQKPKKVENVMPQRPEPGDPETMILYNAEMNEYILKEMQDSKKESLEQKQQAEDSRKQSAAREWAVGELVKVNKNPEKSQRIMGFFADGKNLTPAMYNVMYDAAMNLNKIPSNGKDDPNTPPPPVGGGGKPETGEKTPDDDFNEQLGQDNQYRL